jgi:hypothetical protein
MHLPCNIRTQPRSWVESGLERVPLRHFLAQKGPVESGARRGVAAATGYAKLRRAATQCHYIYQSRVSSQLSRVAVLVQ